jgi:hypothetical protein
MVQVPYCLSYYCSMKNPLAIFVAPLFDIQFFLSFADDRFMPRIPEDLSTLVHALEKSLFW